MKLSVLIPTHDPRADYLERTLAALRSQTMPTRDWELLLIDNCSEPPLPPSLVAWHPHGRIVPAPVLGLTHARLAGLAAATGEMLIWVDDDNLLAPEYLEIVGRIFADQPKLGAAGGKSMPDYEKPPPSWYHPDLAPLGCRDLGDVRREARWADGQPKYYPDMAPIGAGLAIRKGAMERWAALTRNDPRRLRLGRTGTALTSGEDNDINLTLLAEGWTLAYEPALSLKHLIPPRRLTLDYQCRIARATFRDFVRVLGIHGIQPWPPIPWWTLPLRKIKAWFSCRAWAGPVERIQWQGACGQFEGRAELMSR